jgi:L-fuconolactonase
LRVDAHHHLWHYTAAEYGWIYDNMRALRRDFLPPELAGECEAAGVSATVAVQARQTLEETYWLLEQASQTLLIRGVVGWADIASADFSKTLETLQNHSLLKGLRHVVQAEPDGFLDSPDFNRGIAAVTETGLVYDILILARHLPEATRFVDRHPQQSFVLDHIAKPSIAAGEIAQWSVNLGNLARRPNVACKLSGMVTEADWAAWTPASLQPYFDTALEAFGPTRLMAGSDWPVLTVASSYGRWWQTIEGWLSPLAVNERAQIEGKVANRIYGLGIDI